MPSGHFVGAASSRLSPALLKFLTYRDAIADPIAWLFVVVRRLESRRTRRVEVQSAGAPAPVDPWPEIDLRMDARRLLARISPRDRRSICLSLVGFSERETAGHLGCSLKATEKSLHRARRQLRHLSSQ